jgi:hypothetical protein
VPGKRVARHVQGGARRRGWVVAVVLGVVLVVGGALLGRSTGLFSGADDQADSSPTQGIGDPSSPSVQATDDGTSRAAGRTGRQLRACAAQLSAADRVAAAAAPGVVDWHNHVQARTDMLAGRISPERMRAIWARTRRAGPGDQARFHAATKGFHSTADCDRLANGSDAAKSTVTDCRKRARLADRAVAAAAAAMRDWRSHLANMAAYAHGHMTSGMAQHMWVSAWRNAPPHISAYHHARAALAAAPACKGTRG